MARNAGLIIHVLKNLHGVPSVEPSLGIDCTNALAYIHGPCKLNTKKTRIATKKRTLQTPCSKIGRTNKPRNPEIQKKWYSKYVVTGAVDSAETRSSFLFSLTRIVTLSSLYTLSVSNAQKEQKIWPATPSGFFHTIRQRSAVCAANKIRF